MLFEAANLAASKEAKVNTDEELFIWEEIHYIVFFIEIIIYNNLIIYLCQLHMFGVLSIMYVKGHFKDSCIYHISAQKYNINITESNHTSIWSEVSLEKAVRVQS